MPATQTDRLNKLTTSVAVKPPCVAVTSTNITLSGLQGYAQDDRVLVNGQTNSVNNGIYNANTGAWTRAKDFDGNRDAVQGTLVLVRNAIINGAIYQLTTPDPVIFGVSSIAFELRDDPRITYDQSQDEINAGSAIVDNSRYYGDVLRYGSNTTPGSTNMAAAFQAAVNANASIFVPRGNYYVPTTVNLRDDIPQTIRGEGRDATNITSPPGVETFKWQSTGVDKWGPTFQDMYIKSDYPIVINNLTAFIDINNVLGDASVIGAQVRNLLLVSRSATVGTTAVGRGITACKMFDSEITLCNLIGFQDGIFLHGCDINTVSNNRIQEFSRFGICDQSAQTFGSQNDIHHNDILSSVGTTATYIKSSSIHVSIHDNYMEKPGGTCFAFVDASDAGAPVLGTNTTLGPWSVSIIDNRCDGEAYATHIYRIDQSEAVSIRCCNRNTTGVGGGISSFIGTVYPFPNTGSGKQRYIEIEGLSWGIWDSYRSAGPYVAGPRSFWCTGENSTALILKDNTQNVQIFGKRYILASSFTGIAWIVPGYTLANQLFKSGVDYALTIIARSTAAAGDSLKVGMGSDGHGDATLTFALTNQYGRIDYAFSGRALAGFDNFGAYLQRVGAVGNIEILSLTWEERENVMASLPSVAPAGGSKSLYYDGADSNRVKFVP